MTTTTETDMPIDRANSDSRRGLHVASVPCQAAAIHLHVLRPRRGEPVCLVVYAQEPGRHPRVAGRLVAAQALALLGALQRALGELEADEHDDTNAKETP